MKKVILTVALFTGFGLAASAQLSENGGCGPDASPIWGSCWSGCVSVMTLEGPRKPSGSEYFRAVNVLEEWCANKPTVLLSPA